MARRRREISFPLVLVLSRCFVFVLVCVSSSGFFTTINLCKEYERKLTAFDGGVSVRFTRWPPFDVSAAESLLSPRLDPISVSTGRSLLPSQCLPPHTSYLHGVSRDDAVDQIWGLYRSGKQTKPDLALRPPSRYKPTKNYSATNPATELLHQPNEDAAGQIWRLNRSGKQTKSDPVSLDDAAAQIWGFFRSGKQIKPVPALRPSSRHSATNLSPVSHLKDRPLPPPSTLTLAPPSPARRSMPSTMTPANPPCSTLPSTRTPASTPMYEQPPLDLTMGMTTGETLILQMGCFFGMGLAAPGPKRFRPWPVYEFIGQTQASTDMLQQPATIAKDFISLAKSFRTLPFRFISRSEKSIVDDLAKTASRSMTTGLLLPCNLLF